MSADVTALLQRWTRGDESALEQLLPIVYDELKRVAGRQLAGERAAHTLQPTALVNEAFLRLCAQSSGWRNRSHFIGVAAEMMRRILVDYARARGREKRGGEVTFVHLEAADGERVAAPARNVIEVDDALLRLAEFDARQARIVELRFFGGLTLEETAEALGLSVATIKREWTLARAWLHRELSRR